MKINLQNFHVCPLLRKSKERDIHVCWANHCLCSVPWLHVFQMHNIVGNSVVTYLISVVARRYRVSVFVTLVSEQLFD